MNKPELVAAIAASTGKTKKDTEVVLDAVVDLITEALAKGDSVRLLGFGSFIVKDRPAQERRNPRTGESFKAAASKAPAFKAGKELREKVK